MVTAQKCTIAGHEDADVTVQVFSKRTTTTCIHSPPWLARLVHDGVSLCHVAEVRIIEAVVKSSLPPRQKSPDEPFLKAKQPAQSLAPPGNPIVRKREGSCPTTPHGEVVLQAARNVSPPCRPLLHDRGSDLSEQGWLKGCGT